MHRLTSILLNIVWALWLGGLVMLLLAVTSLFQTFATDHTTAGTAASGIFQLSNKYRLALLGAALVLSIVRQFQTRGGWAIVAFAFFSFAGAATVTSFAVLTPRIEALRMQHMTTSPEFGKLHGISMALFLGETIAVFLAGIFVSLESKK